MIPSQVAKKTVEKHLKKRKKPIRVTIKETFIYLKNATAFGWIKEEFCHIDK